MERENLFNYIKQKLAYLSTLIKMDGKLNQLSINSHCEQFYCGLFNLIFGYSLKDINTLNNKGNVEGIDLIDDVNKIFIQVSSELSTEKINDSLSKKSLKSYTNYHFLFISISKEVTSYFKNNTYNTPNNISFNPQDDIFGINEIAYKINPLPIKELKEIRNYVQDELDFSVDEFKLDSNLTKVVNALASNASYDVDEIKFNDFAIADKIKFNELDDVEDDIFEKMAYYSKLNSIYKEYSNGGKDISNFVFTRIRALFRKIDCINNVDKFDQLIEDVCIDVKKSGNFNSDMPNDEIYFYAQIIVVDAFIKCKVFKNPKEYNYVVAE